MSTLVKNEQNRSMLCLFGFGAIISTCTVLLDCFAQYLYSFYTFTGVIKQNIHAFLQVNVSFSNFTHYTHNNKDI